MKTRTNELKGWVRGVLLAFTLILVATLTGCIGMPEFDEIDYVVEESNEKILNLRYYGRDLDAQEKSEAVVEYGLLDETTEDYGYYFLEYGYSKSRGDVASWHTLFLPLLLLTPLGMPTDSAEFDTLVSISIFDSNGDLIKRYAKQDDFKRYAGMYYGWYGEANKLSEVFSAQLQDVFDMVSNNSDEINEQLMLAGPINAENRSEATKNLEAYIYEKDVYIHEKD